MPIRIKRIYDPPSPGDGHRVLVDRLWPRGVSKERATLDGWAKEIAPSHELRRWYHAQERPFEEFAERYRAELDGRDEDLAELRALARSQTVTLLTTAHDVEHSNASVLAGLLD